MEIQSNDILMDLIRKMSEDIEKKHYEIILQRLKEVAGIDFDFESEKKRRFKNVLIVHEGEKQKVYYNDGSVDGLLIVTFVLDYQPPSLNNIGNEVNFELKYY